MDVKNIVTFLEVADTKSFSISALNLAITQPAVSKRVATLEEQLSTRLFDRIGRKVLLTDAAEELLPLAKKIVAELDLIEERMFQLGNSVAGKLGIVSSPHVASTYLPEFLHKFRTDFPEVDVSLEIRPSPQLVEDVEHGLFEIGLCELPETQHVDITSRQIWREKLRVVVSATHPLANLPDLHPEELTAYPSVLPPISTTSRTLISNALTRQGLSEKNTTVVPNFNTLAKMVDTGLGWGILPESMCCEEKFTTLKLNSIEMDLCTFLIHHRNLTLSHAATAFAKALPDRIDPDNVPL